MGKKIVGLATALLLGVVLASWSCTRMHEVEESALEMTYDLRGESADEGRDANYQTSVFHQGDSINMGGVRTDEHVMQEGVFFTFNSARLVTDDELGAMCGYSDILYSGGPIPLFVLVDLTIENQSDEPTPALWFSLESGSLSVPCEERATEVLNGFSVDENYEATNEFYYRAEPHSTQNVVLAFELEADFMSEEQWRDVRTMDYSLVYIDYPNKLTVELGSPEEWL